MADTIKYTQAQYEKLLAAYSSGVKMVRYEDHWTEYRSLEDMRQILTDMERYLNINAGKSPIKHIRVSSTKGL